MAATFAQDDFLPYLPLYQLTAAIANAYAAIGRSDLKAADKQLKSADVLAATTPSRARRADGEGVARRGRAREQ